MVLQIIKTLWDIGNQTNTGVKITGDMSVSAVPTGNFNTLKGFKETKIEGFRVRIYTESPNRIPTLRFDCFFSISWDYNGNYITNAKVSIDKVVHRDPFDNVEFNIEAGTPENISSTEDVLAKLKFNIRITVISKAYAVFAPNDSSWNGAINIYGNGTYKIQTNDNYIGPDNIEKIGHCTKDVNCNATSSGCKCDPDFGRDCNPEVSYDKTDPKNWFCTPSSGLSGLGGGCECDWDKHSKFYNNINDEDLYEGFNPKNPDGSLSIMSIIILIILSLLIIFLIYFLLKRNKKK
jgi:hypothetical protein